MIDTAYEVLTCVGCHRSWPLDQSIGEFAALRYDFGNGVVVCSGCFLDSLISDAMQRRMPDTELYDPDANKPSEDDG